MAEDNDATTRSTTRFTDSVSGDELIEGDRISKHLVARTPGQLGQPTKPAHPEGDSPPQTQLLAVTEIDRYDDTHSALLLDPETETWIRASRHNSSSAWSQKEEDWKVRELGTEINVTDATVEDWGESEPVESDRDWMGEWIDMVFGDIQAGHFDEYSDRRTLSGSTLHMHDEMGGHKGYATIKLDQ